MRGTLAMVTLGAVLAMPSVASAQGECPDGWFCEEQEAPAEGSEDASDAESEAGEAAPAPRKRAPAAESTQKPVPVIIVDRPENVPPPPKKRRRSEWGVNMRLEGVLMDDEDRDEDAGMGGLGVSLRYRPIPHFAFDAGLDFIGGTDWAGRERRETALLLSGIVFFNPRSKVQVYALGGIGFSGARVTFDQQTVENADGSSSTIDEYEREYSYFGAHLGGGLEFRVSRKVALNLDVIGFIRDRTDDLADSEPEFVDEDTGRVTNTSGGGLGRFGVTIYW
ncbi:MAG TPA: outer membrane beta-barrel protein [Polyangiaceae bacterium]|nr:outer membrane beta-barrel protein [Polyangiaceae bacterium]